MNALLWLIIHGIVIALLVKSGAATRWFGLLLVVANAYMMGFWLGSLL